MTEWEEQIKKELVEAREATEFKDTIMLLRQHITDIKEALIRDKIDILRKLEIFDGELKILHSILANIRKRDYHLERLISGSEVIRKYNKEKS